jgi:hypothetical protein
MSAPISPEGRAPVAVQRLRTLSHLLDDSIPVPGTGFRFGIDALIGLLPGVGDAAGAALSAYVLLEAGRLGVPRATLLRMAGNVAIEAVVGAVPFLGDLFDAGWKANLRNLRLVEAHLGDPRATTRASRGWVAGAVGLVVLLLAGSALLAGWVVVSLVRLLS